jgi:hypothetical protein
MSRIIVFIVIMVISLMLGGIASGIYVAMMRNRSPEEQKEKPVSIAPVVSFIMITSLLTGVIVYGIYYLVTIPPSAPPAPPCPKCAKCLLSEDDFSNLRKAEKVITDFQRKAAFVPDVAVQETCSKRMAGVGGGSCGNFFRSGDNGDGLGGLEAVSMPPYIPIKTPTRAGAKAAPAKPSSYQMSGALQGAPKLQRRVGFEGFPPLEK